MDDDLGVAAKPYFRKPPFGGMGTEVPYGTIVELVIRNTISSMKVSMFFFFPYTDQMASFDVICTAVEGLLGHSPGEFFWIPSRDKNAEISEAGSIWAGDLPKTARARITFLFFVRW